MSTYPVISMINDQPCFGKPLHEIIAELEPGGALEIVSPEDCISGQQSKWLHCKGGPIMYLVGEGWEFEDAKRFLKITHGRKIFVRDLTDKNCYKAKGVFFWECRIASCRKLIFPWEVVHGAITGRKCPHCMQGMVYPIILKSITQVAPSRIKAWFDTIIDRYDGVFPPNPKLRKKP